MYIPFNSRKPYHKSVFGAIRQNEVVTFRVVLPREMNCSAVCLKVREDSEAKEEAFNNYFKWERKEGENEEWWTLDYKAEKTGLYMYVFQCFVPQGSVFIVNNGRGEGVLADGGDEFQLTVYSEDYKTPDHLKGGVIYQIFPDRFYCSGEKKTLPPDRIIRKDWYGTPFWKPDKNGRVLNNDYFGGDLRGIEEKLPYLEQKGVTAIYLNPIFEANSNHRYDTADYSKIDCCLGTEKDFASLCKKAKDKNISIILDGVFSHTGSDSVYFNKYGRYSSLGAYQSKKSPYYSWYSFFSYPEKYSSWWGIDILPEVDENNQSYIDFITGENGIAKKWLRLGACGYRLDVADELPDKFLDAFRKAVKDENSEAYILGEVWEDASNKSSYGKRRRYLQGDQLDSVMNYPFARSIIAYIRTGTAEGFTEKIITVLENYPKPSVDVLMNHIGTHDTERIITALAGESTENRDRLWQSETKLSSEQYEKGVKLLKLASILQYTLPGIPSLYYGDEAGMEGYKDPFNRLCYPWGKENKELLSHYDTLGKMRKENAVFREGIFVPVSESEGTLCYKREWENESIMVIINRNEDDIIYYTDFEFDTEKILFDGKKTNGGVFLKANTGTVLIKRKDDKNE